MTPKTVKLTLALTDDGKFNIDGDGSGGVNKLDQCRALMLGIYAITREELGVNPDETTILNLADWAEQVMN